MIVVVGVRVKKYRENEESLSIFIFAKPMQPVGPGGVGEGGMHTGRAIPL